MSKLLTEKEQLESVKRDGWSIQFIKNPSEKVQLEALKQEPWIFDSIVEPTQKVKMLYALMTKI